MNIYGKQKYSRVALQIPILFPVALAMDNTMEKSLPTCHLDLIFVNFLGVSMQYEVQHAMLKNPNISQPIYAIMMVINIPWQ